MRQLFVFLVFHLISLPSALSCGNPVAQAAQDSEPALNFSLPDMQASFRSQKTRSFEARQAALGRLRDAIVRHQAEVIAALKADLGKPEFEAFVTEVNFVLKEIEEARTNLKSWMAPETVRTPWVGFPARSKIYREPMGVVLVLSPWNYPFQLLMAPLIAAIAAGNHVVVKPAEAAGATAGIIETILREAFSPDYVAVQQGGPDISSRLTHLPVDHIFFTGGLEVGKKILAAAAPNAVPVTLELGGKSPVIVERTANIRRAAEMIVWGSCLNAGQTCVRPDYIIVDRVVKAKLIEEIKRASVKFYGDHPMLSPHLGRIINQHHYDRLDALIKDGTIVYGGERDRDKRFIGPTFLTDVVDGSPLLTQEIFGPITPILEFDGSVEGAAEIVERNPNPLALYCFTEKRAFGEGIICKIPFGGGALNDVVMQIQNPNLPFGGRGQSGMGKYHGKFGFDLFSNLKGMHVDRGSIFDPVLRPFIMGLRVPPYTDLKTRLFRIISSLD